MDPCLTFANRQTYYRNHRIVLVSSLNIKKTHQCCSLTMLLPTRSFSKRSLKNSGKENSCHVQGLLATLQRYLLCPKMHCYLPGALWEVGKICPEFTSQADLGPGNFMGFLSRCPSPTGSNKGYA